jgi:hypothetical protein
MSMVGQDAARWMPIERGGIERERLREGGRRKRTGTRSTHLIRGESLGLAQDFVSLSSGFVEGIHHEMEVVREGAHACDLGLGLGSCSQRGVVLVFV